MRYITEARKLHGVSFAPDKAARFAPALRQLRQHPTATYLKVTTWEIGSDFFMVGVHHGKVFAFVEWISGLE